MKQSESWWKDEFPEFFEGYRGNTMIGLCADCALKVFAGNMGETGTNPGRWIESWDKPYSKLIYRCHCGARRKITDLHSKTELLEKFLSFDNAIDPSKYFSISDEAFKRFVSK